MAFLEETMSSHTSRTRSAPFKPVEGEFCFSPEFKRQLRLAAQEVHKVTGEVMSCIEMVDALIDGKPMKMGMVMGHFAEFSADLKRAMEDYPDEERLSELKDTIIDMLEGQGKEPPVVQSRTKSRRL